MLVLRYCQYSPYCTIRIRTAQHTTSIMSLSPPSPIRVLLVDDSAFMRFTIARYLSESPELLVVGSARDGQEALDMIPELAPDVITLDVQMPRLDGLSTLREIMANDPLPVDMLSSLTTEGAHETVQALTWGAVDFIAKPVSKANIAAIMDELIIKIRHAAQARVWRIPRLSQLAAKPQRLQKTNRFQRLPHKVVVIGTSTGGPRALNTLMSQLPADLPAALFIVQHMPAGFTRSLAERLDNISPLAIREAAHGDRITTGLGLLAPGGFHTTLDKKGKIALTKNPPVHGVRPAVDITMHSVTQQFGAATVGVVLTGMGHDGTNGAALIHSAGGHIIAEDESTCVVWGMPRSVVEAGAADVIVPLPEVAAAIEKAVRT